MKESLKSLYLSIFYDFDDKSEPLYGRDWQVYIISNNPDQPLTRLSTDIFTKQPGSNLNSCPFDMRKNKNDILHSSCPI